MRIERVKAIGVDDKAPGDPTLVKICFGSQQITQFIVDERTSHDEKDNAHDPKKKPEICKVPKNEGKEPCLSNEILNSSKIDTKVTLPTN